LTKPGRGLNQAIEIGTNGLKIGSASHASDPGGPAIIARPDHAIDPEHPDDNHGLFLIPARPTAAEIGAIVWRPHHIPTQPPFEFGVVLRGDVELTDLTVDCNMGQQGLEGLKKSAAERSAMLAFAGQAYNVAPSPTGVARKVFVGFRSVALKNVHTVRGGFADDIWFTRGNFNPNIENVIIENVTDGERVQPGRTTINFSGMCQNVHIHDIDVHNLHLEESELYDGQPRASDIFEPAKWTLSDVNAEFMNLDAPGKVYTLDATNLTITTAFAVSQAGGTITNSTLHIGQGTRLHRMNNFMFDNVTWHLSPNAGNVFGLKPVSLLQSECSVSLKNNRFVVDGTAATGSLVTTDLTFESDDHTKDTKNRVHLSLIGCSYPEPFGRSATMPIAFARERGSYTFASADFGDRDPHTAIVKGSASDIELDFV
jgi:hypothetical protein